MERQVHKEYKEIKGIPEQQGHKDPLDLLVPQALMEKTEQLDRKDP
jgi:hypothetical protein